MITELLIRSYTPAYTDRYLTRICQSVRDNTDLKINFIDHSQVTMEDITYVHGEHLLSIDKFLAKQLNIDYYRVSRIFDVEGNIIGRCADENNIYKYLLRNGNNIRIIDTDIASGNTMKYAQNLFETDRGCALIHLADHQDLLDLEDIIDNNSLFIINHKTIESSYMLNADIFTKRTSLPETVYHEFKHILG